jgi:hypothetical protein
MSAYAPGCSLDLERRRQQLSASVAQLDEVIGIQASDISARGTDAAGVRLPPVLKTLEGYCDAQLGGLDLL